MKFWLLNKNSEKGGQMDQPPHSQLLSRVLEYYHTPDSVSSGAVTDILQEGISCSPAVSRATNRSFTKVQNSTHLWSYYPYLRYSPEGHSSSCGGYPVEGKIWIHWRHHLVSGRGDTGRKSHKLDSFPYPSFFLVSACHVHIDCLYISHK